MKHKKRSRKVKVVSDEHIAWDILSVIVVVGIVFILSGMIMARDVRIQVLSNELETDNNYLSHPGKSYWTKESKFEDWKGWREETAWKNIINADIYNDWVYFQTVYYRMVNIFRKPKTSWET